jgi:hypothetical protein
LVVNVGGGALGLAVCVFIINSAIKVAKGLESWRIVHEQARAAKMENDDEEAIRALRQKYLEKQLAVERDVVKKLLQEKKLEATEEALTHVKTSIQMLTELLLQGAEVRKGLLAPPAEGGTPELLDSIQELPNLDPGRYLAGKSGDGKNP